MAFSKRGGTHRQKPRRPRVAGWAGRSRTADAEPAASDLPAGAGDMSTAEVAGTPAGWQAEPGAGSPVASADRPAEPPARSGGAAAPQEEPAGTLAGGPPDEDGGPVGPSARRPADPEDAGASRDDAAGAGTRRRTSRVRAVLAGIAALGTGLAVWFGVAAHGAAGAASARNAALVDVSTTNAVVSQVGDAIRAAFTYDYNNAASTRQAAQNVLAGNAVDQYTRLFAQVERDAPAQKMVLTTTVRSVGVTELSGDHARLLVFVDQQAVRMDSNQRNSGAAQLDIVAAKSGTSWKITDITVL
jgi:Mce-associated membrane protein